MSTKSDEFEQINYSFISNEKNANNGEKEFIKQVNDANKKQSLTKSFSSSGLNIKKIINKNTLPNINIMKKNKIKFGKKSNLTSNSLNSLKNNSFTDNAYKTYNLGRNKLIINKNEDWVSLDKLMKNRLILKL